MQAALLAAALLPDVTLQLSSRGKAEAELLKGSHVKWAF